MEKNRVQALLSEVVAWNTEEKIQIKNGLDQMLQFDQIPQASSSDIDRSLRRFFTALSNFFISENRIGASRWSLDVIFCTRKKLYKKIEIAHATLESVLDDITKNEGKEFKENKRALFYNLIFTGAMNAMEKNTNIPITLGTFINHLINNGSYILDNSFPGYGSKSLLFKIGVWKE